MPNANATIALYSNPAFAMTGLTIDPYAPGVNLAGTPGADTLIGTNLADTLNGLGGDDWLYGREGYDKLQDGAGDDVLYGDAGFDVLYGNDGNDSLLGGLDPDYLFGGKGDDFLRGGKDRDALVGDAGNDTLVGDLDVDSLWGGSGADIFILRHDTAAPPQVLGTPDLITDGDPLQRLDTVVADVILDYRVEEGDRIGLTGGLSADDLILTRRFLTVGDARDYATDGPYPPNTPRTLDFRITTFAATIIQIAGTGDILGIVKEVEPADLQFISLTDV